MAGTHQPRCSSIGCCVLDRRFGVAEEGSSIAPGEELTLSRAVEIALAHHPARMAAEARAGAAVERIGEASPAAAPGVRRGRVPARDQQRHRQTAVSDRARRCRAPRARARHVNQLTDTFDNYAGRGVGVPVSLRLRPHPRAGRAAQRGGGRGAGAAPCWSSSTSSTRCRRPTSTWSRHARSSPYTRRRSTQRDGASAPGAGEGEGWAQARHRRLHGAVRPGARAAPAGRRAQRCGHREGGARQRHGVRRAAARVPADRHAVVRHHHRAGGARISRGPSSSVRI